jgi:hypothetical protein
MAARIQSSTILSPTLPIGEKLFTCRMLQNSQAILVHSAISKPSLARAPSRKLITSRPLTGNTTLRHMRFLKEMRLKALLWLCIVATQTPCCILMTFTSALSLPLLKLVTTPHPALPRVLQARHPHQVLKVQHLQLH